MTEAAANEAVEALHDLVWCIRDWQLGDYSPLMDEIFDAEAALKKCGRKMRRPRRKRDMERLRRLGLR